jgi:large subunit ribosomal protein L4
MLSKSLNLSKAVARGIKFNFSIPKQSIMSANITLNNQYSLGYAVITRAFSAAASAVVQPPAQPPIDLPANLQLADISIVQPTEEETLPTVEDYLFPLLNVPQTIAVHDLHGTSSSSGVTEAALNQKIFEVAIRKDIVLNLVRYIRNKARQPKRTKRMSEIAGSNKKPRPQKGTGASQVGHRRNSAWRGGQKAHGPVLRDYSIGMNKKQRALGMMMTLAAKYREGNLMVFDKLELESHQTKALQQKLTSHGLGDKLTLVVDTQFQEKFLKASSNLAKAQTVSLDVSILLSRL